MKNKGFTLIELLAVIVILAIIALIAVPIILNIIDSSKTSANQRSKELYLDAVEQAIARKNLTGEYNPTSCTVIENGNLSCEKDGETLDNLTVEVNGTKPSSGTITLENGKVTSSNLTFSNETNTEAEESVSQICTLISGTSKTVGAKYTCSLDTERTFYILEISGDNVSLLMEQNFIDEVIGKQIAWCTDGSNNNTTCKNINTTGNEAPEGKDYIRHITEVFNKEGVIVSFPTEKQMREIGCTEPEYNEDGDELTSCPTWAYDYLNRSTHPVSGVYGYWLSTPWLSSSSSLSFYVSEFGNISLYSVDEGDYGDPTSLRPVITLSKTLLD